MKSIVIIIFAIAMSIGLQAQTVILGDVHASKGGAVYDTTGTTATWESVLYFKVPGNHVITAQFDNDTVSGTANRTLTVEKSFNASDWVVMSTVTASTDVDTTVYFSDTTNYPYVKFKAASVSGTQKTLNKVYYSIYKN